MVSIGGSKGRLGGRGLAIAGLILGLLGTAVWVGVYFAGQAGISQISQYTRFVTLLEQDDVAGARAMVSPTVTVSDEELVAWGDGFEVTHGTFVTQPSGMIEYVSTFVNNTSSNPQLFQAAQQSFPGGSSMMPLPIETTNGQVTVFVIMDQFKGETMVIMGGSGSGKSTTLRMMIGSFPPTEGSIELFGRTSAGSMDEDELNEVRKRFGILFQSGALFNSMTVGENVALPLREHTDLDPEIIDIMVKIKLELVGPARARGQVPRADLGRA
jgi:ABC-type multidrug transport system fused ATPase/permease subunit